MTPEFAGEVCGELDKCLRGAEINLDRVASLMVQVIRDKAWKERKIRTGEIVKCSSFLELLTSPPLKGYGENPHKVEALLKDDPEALRMFREAVTPPNRRPVRTESNDNVITKQAMQGNSLSYTLDRLHRESPALYQQVVDGELSANQAAIQAGFRKVKTPLEQLEHWWKKADASQRAAFMNRIKE